MCSLRRLGLALSSAHRNRRDRTRWELGVELLLCKREPFDAGVLCAISELDRSRDLGKGVLQTLTLTAVEILADPLDFRVFQTGSSEPAVDWTSRI